MKVIESRVCVIHFTSNIITSHLFRCIMEEKDDYQIRMTTDLNRRLIALEKYVEENQQEIQTLRARVWELVAKVEDLHATDSARRLNKATEDPEWY
jgi:uncharacterized protein YlxW (UPF0749 family)